MLEAGLGDDAVDRSPDGDSFTPESPEKMSSLDMAFQGRDQDGEAEEQIPGLEKTGLGAKTL